MSQPTDKEFIAYVGPPSIHDGRVRSVIVNETNVLVEIDTADATLVAIEFTGVSNVKMVEPMGMTLYAISEMKASIPHRGFIFVN